jgi:thiosulfate/3-mercaptopyruvate sulfurtransferase
MSTAHTAPLVDVAWLAAHAADPAVRIVDLRWSLGGPPQAQKYAEGHLPGAVLVDLERDLARPGKGPGRHPLPSPGDFADLLSRIGVAEETRVVAYDDATGSSAARLWFLLLLHGHPRASVLDGGFAAWREAGLPVTAEVPRVAPAAARTLVRDESLLVDRATVAARMAARTGEGPRALLLDARAPERYRGEVEPVDPKAGHIPGAVNAPFADNLRAGRFRTPAELRAQYEALGARESAEVIASCGSGVTACHTLLALAVAGISGAKLYPGSFSDWSRDPASPVATGSDPG